MDAFSSQRLYKNLQRFITIISFRQQARRDIDRPLSRFLRLLPCHGNWDRLAETRSDKRNEANIHCIINRLKMSGCWSDSRRHLESASDLRSQDVVVRRIRSRGEGTRMP